MLMSVIALLALPALVQGHAYIFFPPMRGGAFNNFGNGYCPQCLGSSALPMPVCGKQSFLNYGEGPVTALTVGQRVQFEIRVTAHHKGHFQFRLCNQTISSAMGGPVAEEACLNEHILQRVRPEDVHSDCEPNDARGDCQPFDEANPGYWYLPPAAVGDAVLLEEASPEQRVEQAAFAQVRSHSTAVGATYKFHYLLPQDVTCEKCTLQWWWSSANSCTPHPDAYRCYFQKMERLGWSASAWCSQTCSFSGTCPDVQGPATECGEQFKNCADVSIQSGSTSAQPPESSTLPQMEETVESTPQPESEPESELEEPESATPTMPPTTSVIATLSQTSPPTTSSTTTAASSDAGMRCTATPGLNRGVTDVACARCESGYQWWPCNEDVLCTCVPSLLAVSGRRTPAKEHRFLGLIQQGDEVQLGAWKDSAESEL